MTQISIALCVDIPTFIISPEEVFGVYFLRMLNLFTTRLPFDIPGDFSGVPGIQDCVALQDVLHRRRRNYTSIISPRLSVTGRRLLLLFGSHPTARSSSALLE